MAVGKEESSERSSSGHGSWEQCGLAQAQRCKRQQRTRCRLAAANSCQQWAGMAQQQKPAAQLFLCCSCAWGQLLSCTWPDLSSSRGAGCSCADRCRTSGGSSPGLARVEDGAAVPGLHLPVVQAVVHLRWRGSRAPVGGAVQEPSQGAGSKAQLARTAAVPKQWVGPPARRLRTALRSQQPTQGPLGAKSGPTEGPPHLVVLNLGGGQRGLQADQLGLSQGALDGGEHLRGGAGGRRRCRVCGGRLWAGNRGGGGAGRVARRRGRGSEDGGLPAWAGKCVIRILPPPPQPQRQHQQRLVGMCSGGGR